MNTRDTLRLDPAMTSEAESVTLACEWATTLGIDFKAEDITATLERCKLARRHRPAHATVPGARRAGVLHSSFPRVQARASSSSLPG
ncbi:MAG TPA: hypothetical protein VNG35_14815 [Gemmatimonadales bacterium]|nr:hypothetical protein [Gemmatimonadales bacterium]